MGKYLIGLAGVLSVGIAFVHVIGGGLDVHSPILSSDLSDLLKGYVSVLWHGVTSAIILGSVLLLIAAWHQPVRVTLTLIVIAQYAAFAGVFIYYGILRFQSVVEMPPWIGFCVIISTAMVGLWVDNRDMKRSMKKVSLV